MFCKYFLSAGKLPVLFLSGLKEIVKKQFLKNYWIQRRMVEG
jgi:hypothetical protein